MTIEAVYLDHNATTPVHPFVREAMLPWLGERWGNPSSSHAYGRDAAAALSEARAQIASLVGADPDEVVFTSGGTEADNPVLLGVELTAPRIVVTAVEHPAVMAAAMERARAGVEVIVLAVDREGVVDLDRARSQIDGPVGLATFIAAQNETGVLQPVTELAAIVRAQSPGALVHCDAAQAVGKVPLDMRSLGVDLLTIVGHKFYAPAGIGALVIRRGVTLHPRSLGGGQEYGLRSGTEPVALAVALGAACKLAAGDLEAEAARQVTLRELLWQRLLARVPDLVRTGAGAPTLPNTLHVRVPGVRGADLLAAAPAVAASTGSACHSDHDSPSGVLGAMGIAAREAMGAIRLSLGRSTTTDDIERAATALIQGLACVRAR